MVIYTNHMKIAFVGKGGSGKTTLSALLCRCLAAKGLPVLAMDADINQHLGRSLGLSEVEAAAIPAMGLEINRIKEYVKGKNPLITGNESMIKTTPPGTGSALMKVVEKNPIYEYFSKKIDGVTLLAVGPFDESDLGIKCYHSKTGSVELLLNHLIDKEREYVVVDMTAGADSFASGLFTRFDITFLVVEPTIKSVSVYHQYKKYAKDYPVTIKVIGNKIENDEDADFLEKQIGEDLIALIFASDFVKKIDRGQALPISLLESDNQKAIEKIILTINQQKKDWNTFYRQAVEFHMKNAESWANEAVGKDLAQQIDPNFDFHNAIGV